MTLGVVPGPAMIAIGKRKEQIERWSRSDTAKESTEIKNRPKRVNFAEKCIFLAASSSCDKVQVARMLRDGYDINEVDDDGITALHQACIEDNIEMVEFLLEHGADVNISDSEGWTPLHAVASCNFTSIAKVLLEHGANVSALNNDCSLPVDICKNDDIKDLFKADLAAKGIDVGAARKAEELTMMEDAKNWLLNGYAEAPHPTTGATSMHVAACKGYIKVLDKLMRVGADVNAYDFDGWTPLHAAAHWGQVEACRVLLEGNCDPTLVNNCYQTAFDVADLSVAPILEQYKMSHEAKKRDATVGKLNVLPLPPKKKSLRLAEKDENSKLVTKKEADRINRNAPSSSEEDNEEEEEEDEVGGSEAEDTVGELPSSSLEPIESSSHPTHAPPPIPHSDESPLISRLVSNCEDDNTQQERERAERLSALRENNKTNTAPADPFLRPRDRDVVSNAGVGDTRIRKLGEGDKVSSSLPSLSIASSAGGPGNVSAPKSDYLKPDACGDSEEGVAGWRRGGSLRARTPAAAATVPEEDQSATGDRGAVRRTRSEASPDVSLRRAYSFESDSKFYSRLVVARERLKAIEAVSAAMSANLLDVSTFTATTNARLAGAPAPVSTTESNKGTFSNRAPSAPVSKAPSATPETLPRTVRRRSEDSESERLFNKALNSASDYNPQVILRRKEVDVTRTQRPTTISNTNASPSRQLPGSAVQLRRSFVPPARDEESETQRKAHAKRVRETRRSTQGVTLEELKSAEQYVKAQQSNAAAANEQAQESLPPPSVPLPAVSVAPTATPSAVAALRRDEDSLERRPSWRLRVDDADRSKFSLEDLRSTALSPHQSAFSDKSKEEPGVMDLQRSPVVRVRRHELRNNRPPRPPEDDDDPGQVTTTDESKTGAQGVIAKKKRPKRRSTGVVTYSGTPWSEELDGLQVQSDTESSRKGSDVEGSTGQESPKSENGIVTKVNYKKLYEETLKENQQLKSRVSVLEDEISQLKITLERTALASRIGTDVVDKREKRALELKFQEMEDELKLARTLVADNQKLKDENGALIRVISKLSK